MIVVAIISLLVAIAVPAFMRSRERARTARIVQTLRHASEAFTMYAADNHRYPNGAGPGQIPAGMDLYLQRLRWTEPTLAGGQWQWQGDRSGGTVTIAHPTGTLAEARAIDAVIDDGDENAGLFQVTLNHWRYTVE